MNRMRNLDTASVLLLVGFLCWPLGAGKVIPGGPFLSVLGDVFPATFALIAIACAIPFRSYPLTRIRVSAFAHLALATVLLAMVCQNVVGFYFDPYARGDAIGW